MSEFIAAETDSRRTLVRFEAKFGEHDFAYLKKFFVLTNFIKMVNDRKKLGRIAT